MSWLMVPWSSRDIKQRLSSKYDVNAIPTMIFVDEDAALLTKDGREAVLENEEFRKTGEGAAPHDVLRNGACAHTRLQMEWNVPDVNSSGRLSGLCSWI